MPVVFGGPGVTPGLRGQPTNSNTLEAGQVTLVPPGGWYVVLGRYLTLQQYDSITGTWRWMGDGGNGAKLVQSDGVNTRIANTTGCTIGALITNAGTGYTSAPTCTPSSGSSIWQAVIGGAVNTSITVTNGGSGYQYPPTVLFSAPPSPGIQATGYCTLSAGAVSTVTVTNQGAGYSAGAPTLSFINDPREGLNGTTVGSNAAAVAVTTGAGTMTGLLCLDHGTPLTAVPTFSFAGGAGSAAAATAIMDFTITGFSTANGGAAYTPLAATSAVEISAVGGITAGTAIYTNPSTQTDILRRRRARIYAPTSTAGAITSTGSIVDDGGRYEAVPVPIIEGGMAIVTTAALITLLVGGLNDEYALLAL